MKAPLIFAAVMVLLLIGLVAISPKGGPPPIPFDEHVPVNGVVIYRIDHSRYGFYGNPARIIRIGDLCVTEEYEPQASAWIFEESGKCP